MKSISIGLASALLLIATLNFGVQKQDQVERQLKAAMNTELVDGNLKAAIEQYKKIVDSGIRPLAVQALIHIADCYQKLGDAESQRVYQRVVSDYGDQKDAVAVAQARLGGTAGGSTKRDRAVWTGPGVDQFARVSPDGRFITYVDWTAGSLMIHDLAANTDRVLTPKYPTPNGYEQYPWYSRISKDGRQVLYQWDPVKSHVEFRIASLQGSGFLQPRTVFAGTSDLNNFRSFDWSADGKWIATASGGGKEKPYQIALIAVVDGTFKILKSTDGALPERISFSPDSRYIAYDVPAGGARSAPPNDGPQGRYRAYDLPAADGTGQRDVFVLAIDGSPEIPPVVRGAIAVMGWSPDGSRLLFSSDRTGPLGLWAMRFADGKVQGAPELLKPEIGPGVSLGLTASGTLYQSKSINSRDTVIAPIDLTAGKLLGAPVSFPQGFVQGARTGVDSWSPDGNYLAYPARCQDRGCVAIRSVATGKVSLLPGLARVQGPHWSPDGRSLLTRGVDVTTRNGWFQFDVRTGDVTALTIFSNGERGEQVHWAPDGKVKVYFNRGGVFFERDVASGTEREVNRVAGLVGVGGLSPDGQYFAPILSVPSSKSASLLLVPVTGGQPRELLSLTQPEGFGNCCEWAPDSSAVLFVKNTGSRRELWSAPVIGGRPRKLDIDPDIWLSGSPDPEKEAFALSRDGQYIAFQTGKTVNEVWALENFLPAAKAKK